jgi:serine/threonine protein kinase
LLAVHLMERFDIVHRDLKPENILIQDHSDSTENTVEIPSAMGKRVVSIPDVKIADLGYAIKLEEHY